MAILSSILDVVGGWFALGGPSRSDEERLFFLLLLDPDLHLHLVRSGERHWLEFAGKLGIIRLGFPVVGFQGELFSTL